MFLGRNLVELAVTPVLNQSTHSIVALMPNWLIINIRLGGSKLRNWPMKPINAFRRPGR